MWNKQTLWSGNLAVIFWWAIEKFSLNFWLETASKWEYKQNALNDILAGFKLEVLAIIC